MAVSQSFFPLLADQALALWALAFLKQPGLKLLPGGSALLPTPRLQPLPSIWLAEHSKCVGLFKG